MFRRIFSKKNKVLISELVRTDFKLRYQGSVLGYAWSLLRPLFLFLILYMVFVKLLKLGNGIPHYPVYLLLGIVLWNFFVEMTTQSLGSIVGRGDLIRKIKIPRWIIVISTSLSATINLLLNLIVVAVFMYLNNVNIGGSILWAPLIFLELYILALGVSFFLSAAFVKFRDIGYVWEVLLQAGFYATPILYPLSSINSVSLQKIILLNPLAQAIQSARYQTITTKTITAHGLYQNSPIRFVPYIIVITVFIYGALFFKKKSKYFAEEL